MSSSGDALSMGRVVRVIVIMAFLFPAMLAAAPTKLAGAWEYRVESKGEVPAHGCQQAAVWKAFRFPGQPPGLKSGEVIWQRVLVTPAESQPILKFMTVDQFTEVYLGDKLIYAAGNPGAPGVAVTLGNTPHMVEFPRLKAPAPLCFRIFSRTANVGLNGDVYLGTEKEILTLLITKDLSRLILIALYLVCAVALIIFRFARSTDKAFLSWGLYLLSFSIWLLTQTEIKQFLYADAFAWRIIDYAAIFQLPIWIALFLEQIFGPGLYKALRRMRQVHTIVACGLALLILGGFILAENALIIIQIGIAIQLLIFMLVLSVLALQGDNEARIFFGAAIAFGLTGLHDILAGLTVLPWSFPVSIWGTLLVLVAATAILIRRYAVLRPEERNATHPVFVILQTKFGLTYQEAQICAELDEGAARGDIAEKLAIRANTLKIHLRSIYAKTIDRAGRQAKASRDKLQRLTIFLKRLQARS